MKRSRSYRIGQGLAEYGVIAALLAIASLGVVTFVSNDLSAIFTDLLQDVKSQGTASAAMIEAPGTGAPDPSASPSTDPSTSTAPPSTTPPASSNSSSNAADTQVCFSTGWCVSNPSTVSTTGSTSGALGTSELTLARAEVLRQIANELALDDNADPAILDLIRQLANNGYTLGNEQESMAVSCKAVLKGQQNAGCSGAGLAPAAAGFVTKKSEFDTFISTNPNALPSDVAQFIRGAAQDIQNELATFNPLNDQQTGSQTNANSTAICNAGGGNANQGQCQ